MDQTRGHLELLGIFHYVVAGLSLFCGGLYGLWLILFVGSMKTIIERSAERSREAPPPEVLGAFSGLFAGMGVMVIVVSAGSAVLFGVAGYCLRSRQAWVYCVVVAALSLLWWAPLGTVLGVFSLIVLMRPEAKALFTGAGSGAPQPPAI